MSLFDLSWQESQLTSGSFGEVYQYKHEHFGYFYITDYMNDELIRNSDGTDNYKYLSFLREKYLNKIRVLICDEKERDKLIGFRDGKCEIVTTQSVLQSFPSNITDKTYRSLINLSKIQSGYGDRIDEINTYDCYAKNNQELLFILNILRNKNCITHTISITGNYSLIMTKGIIIEENGWIEIEKQINSKSSKQVFVAMWFDSKLLPAFDSISRACNDNKYSAFRIDYKEHNNEISGEILAEIRKSKFFLAEVTGQRPGVYFEAGYALALGLPVIWCCRKDDLQNVHFDTRQYNHIVWDNEEDLYIKLKNRIIGTIN